jgi:hypothetical protein
LINNAPVRRGNEADVDCHRMIKHARYYWLLLAESHLTRRLFGRMVRRIAALAVPSG